MTTMIAKCTLIFVPQPTHYASAAADGDPRRVLFATAPEVEAWMGCDVISKIKLTVAISTFSLVESQQRAGAGVRGWCPAGVGGSGGADHTVAGAASGAAYAPPTCAYAAAGAAAAAPMLVAWGICSLRAASSAIAAAAAAATAAIAVCQFFKLFTPCEIWTILCRLIDGKYKSG